jgi:NADH-quinone oxidoreductase subunit M
MLILLRAVLFDKVTRPEFANLKDLNWRDYALLGPLAAIVIWLGIYPTSFTGVFDASVASMVQAHVASLQSHVAAAPLPAPTLAMVTK